MLPKPKPRAEYLKGTNLKPLLGKSGTVRATIVGEPSEGQYGIDLPVKVAGQNMVLTVDPEGSNYRTIYEALGGSESDWVKATLVLSTRISAKTNNPYVVVDEAEEA